MSSTFHNNRALENSYCSRGCAQIFADTACGKAQREEAGLSFQCESAALLQGVASVDRAISNNDVEPLLSGILVEVEGDRVRLVATDREIGVERTVPAQVTQPGRWVVDGKLFSGIVRKLPADEVIWRMQGEGQAVVESGRARFTLQTRSAEDFPELTPMPEEYWRISQSDLRSMIRQTVFATAREESRPLLTGVLIEIEGDQIAFAATDANRLALRKGRLLQGGQKSAAAVVPAKSLNEVLRLLSGDAESVVDFGIQGNEIIFSLPEMKFVSRLIEGQFPDYRRVFPAQLPVRFRIERNAFLDAVDRASLVTRNGTPFVRLSVSNNSLAVTASEAEVGQAHEEIPVEQDGEDLEMSYQARFLMDVLRVIEQDYVEVHMGKDLMPAVIHGVDDDAYRYVVMPVRVG